MTQKSEFSPIALLLLSGASFVLVVAGLQSASSIFNSFFLALIIAISTIPIVLWLSQKKIPRGLAILITILLVLAGGLILIGFLGISISKLLHILPSYETKIASLTQALKDFLSSKGIDSAGIFSPDLFSPANLIGRIAVFLKSLAEVLSTSLLLLFIVAFMLVEGTGLTMKLERGLGVNNNFISKFKDFSSSIRSYVFITAWTGALTAFADFIVLSLLGVDLAWIWGVLFFVFNFIPAVGFLLAVIPPVFLALLEFDGQKAFLVFFCCWMLDNITDKVIKPRYMQQGLDISPLVIILSIIFWSWVLGPTGALLAVPLTLMVKKLVLENFEETQFLAILMSSGDISEKNTDSDQ